MGIRRFAGRSRSFAVDTRRFAGVDIQYFGVAEGEEIWKGRRRWEVMVVE